MMKKEEKKGVELCKRVGNGVGEIVDDRREVKKIMIKIEKNEVKFKKQGGCVKIDEERVMEDG